MTWVAAVVSLLAAVILYAACWVGTDVRPDEEDDQ